MMRPVLLIFLFYLVLSGCRQNLKQPDIVILSDTTHSTTKYSQYRGDSIIIKREYRKKSVVHHHYSEEELFTLAVSNPAKLEAEEFLHAATLTSDNNLKSKILRNAVKKFPKNWKILNNAAIIEINRGNFDHARKLLLKADSLNSNDLTQTNLRIVTARQKKIKSGNLNKIDSLHLNETPYTADHGYQKEVVNKTTQVLSRIDSIYNAQYILFKAGQIDGYVDYVFKKKMRVNDAKPVSVVISKNYPHDKLIKEVQSFINEDSVQRKVIRISRKVIVVLQEASEGTFFIKPRFLSPSQPVDFNDKFPTEFCWDVTPLKEGKHKLSFHVNLVIDSSSTPVCVKSYDGEILVESDKSFFRRILDWVEQHLTLLSAIASGIFAVFVWLYKEKIITFFKK